MIMRHKGEITSRYEGEFSAKDGLMFSIGSAAIVHNQTSGFTRLAKVS